MQVGAIGASCKPFERYSRLKSSRRLQNPLWELKIRRYWLRLAVRLFFLDMVSISGQIAHVPGETCVLHY